MSKRLSNHHNMKNLQNKNNILKINVAIAATIISFACTHAYASDISNKNLLELINKERTSRGLSKLVENQELDQAAYLKAKDMINRNYFEHYAYGLTPWDFIKISGYDYLYAGENLAMDFRTSEGMVKAWMNSPSHRDNILNPDYQDIGLGVVKGEYSESNNTESTIMVSNMFGRKKPTIMKIYEYFSKNIFGNF
jgi:uncharacterized protein YkwD